MLVFTKHTQLRRRLLCTLYIRKNRKRMFSSEHCNREYIFSQRSIYLKHKKTNFDYSRRKFDLYCSIKLNLTHSLHSIDETKTQKLELSPLNNQRFRVKQLNCTFRTTISLDKVVCIVCFFNWKNEKHQIYKILI